MSRRSCLLETCSWRMHFACFLLISRCLFENLSLAFCFDSNTMNWFFTDVPTGVSENSQVESPLLIFMFETTKLYLCFKSVGWEPGAVGECKVKIGRTSPGAGNFGGKMMTYAQSRPHSQWGDAVQNHLLQGLTAGTQLHGVGNSVHGPGPCRPHH